MNNLSFGLRIRNIVYNNAVDKTPKQIMAAQKKAMKIAEKNFGDWIEEGVISRQYAQDAVLSGLKMALYLKA